LDRIDFLFPDPVPCATDVILLNHPSAQLPNGEGHRAKGEKQDRKTQQDSGRGKDVPDTQGPDHDIEVPVEGPGIVEWQRILTRRGGVYGIDADTV
jgi:hypothetical protein